MCFCDTGTLFSTAVSVQGHPQVSFGLTSGFLWPPWIVLGPSGCPASPLRGPFVSFATPLGSSRNALGPPFGRFELLWVAVQHLWAPKWPQSDQRDPRGAPKGPPRTASGSSMQRNTCVFVCFYVFVCFGRFRGRNGFEPKHTCFCVFLSRIHFRCRGFHVFLCVFSRPRSCEASSRRQSPLCKH